MKLQVLTALMCIAGWVLHWLASWGVARIKEKKSLLDFLDDDPAALWYSIISTAVIFAFGPSLMPMIGIHLEDTNPDTVRTLALLSALFAGYFGDSIVRKLVTLGGAALDKLQTLFGKT